MATQKVSLKDALGKVECYSANISELASEVGDEFVTDDGNVIEIDYKGVIKLIQVFWNKIKETALECEGKQIVVKLPEGLVGNLIAALLSLFNFKL